MISLSASMLAKMQQSGVWFASYSHRKRPGPPSPAGSRPQSAPCPHAHSRRGRRMSPCRTCDGAGCPWAARRSNEYPQSFKRHVRHGSLPDRIHVTPDGNEGALHSQSSYILLSRPDGHLCSVRVLGSFWMRGRMWGGERAVRSDQVRGAPVIKFIDVVEGVKASSFTSRDGLRQASTVKEAGKKN